MQLETLHRVILYVTGMSCDVCTSNVTRALVAIDGVHDVQVSLSSGEVVVQFDQQFTSSDKLKLAVEDAGYEVIENIET